MLTFLHPVFLWGLLGLGVPVFLHLMNRQLPRRLRFPSVRFLRKARLPREGRRRLRDVIVLLLRLAALALLIAALSMPTWRPRSAGAAQGAEADGSVVVILLDVSASMSADGVLAAARDRLTALEDELSRAAAVGAVVSAGGVVESVTPAPWETGAARKALFDARPQAVEGRHAAGLKEAARMLTGDGRRELILGSDFRQSDWGAIARGLVPSTVAVRLMDVGNPGLKNAGVVQAMATPLADGRARVVVEARNFSTVELRREVAVRLRDEVQWQEVTLPPLQNRRVVFTGTPDDTQAGIALLSEDGYPLDNELHFWAGPAPPVQVLAVVPLEQEPEKANELFFVKKALSVSEEGARVRFVVDETEPEFLFALDLSEVRILFLLGAAGHFQANEFQRLARYLDTGGTVIVTPGATAAHQFQGLRLHRILASKYIKTVDARRRGDALSGLGWVNPTVPLGRVFDEPEETDLFLFPVYRYTKLSPDAAAVAHLKLLDGSPALLEEQVGRGRIYVTAFSLGPGWSDLPMTASFLPLVRELVAGAVPADYGVRRVHCGDPLPVVKDLLGRDVTAAGGPSADTLTPGIRTLGDRPLAVNVSRQESVATRANLFDLEQALTGSPDDAREADAARPDAVTSAAGYDLWPWLAVAGVICLALELGVCGWLDGRERVARAAA